MILLCFGYLGISLEVLSLRPFELGNESVWIFACSIGSIEKCPDHAALGTQNDFVRIGNNRSAFLDIR
jgi:hypothetical protein